MESREEYQKIYYDLHGLPAISVDYGVRYRNLTLDGIPLSPGRVPFGTLAEENGEYVIRQPEGFVDPWLLDMEASPLAVFGEDLDAHDGTFECEVFAEEGKEISIGMLVAPKPLSYYDRTNPNPKDPWSLRFLECIRWVIKDDTAYLARGNVALKRMSNVKKAVLKRNAFNRIRYTIEGSYVDLYLNDELIDHAELPYYPSLGSVVTDTADTVIIKIVNFAYESDDVEITLDCEVASEYRVDFFTGKAEAENSIENPEVIRDETVVMCGAAKTFTYKAPALSVNILILNKK